MPTYEYECRKCGHEFELFQPITDKPRRTCPKCRGRVQRLVGTGAGVIFKGSGFYSTDYRKPGYQEAAKKETSSATGDKTAADKPAETKAAAPAKSSTTKG
ncbi:zinc ribbon domain-containing protein [bacterium]|nr:zinc ribbon domain-containing protein [bacterium]